MSRRTSQTQPPNSTPPGRKISESSKSKRVSVVAPGKNEIREGDTYYKTVRIFPSCQPPEHPDDVLITIGRMPKEQRAGSSAEKGESRRNSVMSERDTNTPDPALFCEYIPRAASLAASAGGGDTKRPRLVIWPEWSDADVNAEKWDVAHKGKEKDKGKSPVVQHSFDDPEGKLETPPSLKVDNWKRPQDFILEKTPVIVDQDLGMTGFDLITGNEHLHDSELMRYIISQIGALWDMSAVKNPPQDQSDPSVPYEEYSYSWRPWEHIYALAKVTKGPHVPPYNPYGKYVVRLYWMGCWRKIIVDDTMPFDENDQLLLPSTTLQHELWPMLLTKAIIKIASLDYTGGSPSSEFGDCSVVHCLTGWLPEAIPLQYGHIMEIWELLKNVLPEWKLPEQEWEKQQEVQDKDKKEGDVPSTADGQKEDKGDKDAASKDGKDKPDAKSGKEGGKEKAKDGKDKDKGGKDKDKKDKGDKDKKGDKEKSLLEETPIPENPEVVVFATYWSAPKYPCKISVLGEMADASERLRQNGLSHLYPHPVCVSQTRSCPLEPPPPPEKIPAWKLIRPKKKKPTPSDEPVAEPEPPKPIQCLEITSPFVNYRVSPVPIPTDTHRPKSALERGGTRSRPATGNVESIEETDETIPEPEPEPPKEKEEEPEEIPQTTEGEVTQSGKPSTPNKDKGKDKGSRKSSATKKDGKEVAGRESSPKAERKSSNKSADSQGKTAKGDRVKSATRTDRPSSKDEKGDKEKSKDKGDGKQPTVPPQTAVPPPQQPPLAADSGQLPPGVDSGLAPPPEGAEEGLEGELAEVMPEEEEAIDTSPKPKKVWIDFDQFTKCFKTLYIFHKPNTYPCNVKHSDLKSVAPSTAPAGKGDKKSVPATAGSSGYDDRAPHYLFVDNLKPTEIVVSFSSLSRWHEPPTPLPVEDKKSHTSVKGGKDKGDAEKEPTTITSSSLLEGSIGREQTVPVVVTPGTLVAEPYSWKSLVTGQPIMRLRSTATRAAVLSLPAGRHVLRFMMSGPLGYHVHLCSSVQFVFGDEEKVMEQLTKESCRFVDNAIQVMNSIGKCINTFSDHELFKQAWEELVDHHCPYRRDKLMSKQHHFQVFNEALYHTLRKSLTDIASPEIAFAWRCLVFDCLTKNIMGLPSGSRPATGTTSHRGSAKQPTDKKKQAPVEGEPEKVENVWANREATPEEHVATVKIQRQWKGYWVRKIRTARTPVTEENLKVVESLQKSWAVLEQSLEQNGLFLFRYMFKIDPDIMPKYPFYQDEWNKISYADYQGQYPDQPVHNWFVVFREIFYVSEEMLTVPKLYVPINTCMLRVVNNDTGEEIPRVFQKVAPYVYRKNKRGYTFVAEARTTDQQLVSGRWRMRLIGSLSPLPSPVRNEVNSTFNVREIKDYYVPNDKNIVFRYAVKVTEDHLTSIQMNTSKSDVYIKLMVLDNEEEMTCTVGKGHAVIPAFCFLKDINPEEETKRSSSRTSNRGGKGGVGGGAVQKTRRTSSAKSDGRASRGSHHSDTGLSDEVDEKDLKPHKYIIQAMVLRNSWPLSESSWTFVQMLKETEKNELKVANRERPPSPPKDQKAATTTAGQKGAKGGKGGKDKGGKDKDQKGSRPPSQQFDNTKPSWTLRIVSDANVAEDIDVKKDTERADEIRALKKAWEDAEPGRAAKAMQSRLKYLSTHTIKAQPDKEEEEGEEGVAPGEAADILPPQTPASLIDHIEAEGNLTLEPPTPPTPKEILQPVDITPFIRRGSGETRYLDEEEMQRRLEEQQRQIQEYKAFRQQVEQWREHDRQMRNLTKQRQLEQCEELQAMLDAARESINEPREAFRQKYLEAERKKQEELAAQEAALKADLEAKSPKRGKSANKGKKSPGGGKKKK